MISCTDTLKAKLDDSPLKCAYQSLIQGDTPYARCAAEELLSPGILPNVNHICKTCVGYLSKGKCNHRALVSGYFCGSVPPALAKLDSVETSMVSLINATTEVKYVKGGMKSTTDTVSYTNDVVQIAQNLPNLQGLAILRDRRSRIFPFRPKAVYDALIWLKANNVLYKHVSIVFPAEWGPEDEVADATTLVYGEEDVQSVLHGESTNGAQLDGNATNTAAVAPVETFIADYNSAASTISVLEEVVANAEADTSKRGPFMQRADGTKVSRHEIPEYDAMCFPVLYPYGYGSSHVLDRDYVRHRMTCGGSYRRFSDSLRWLFTHYGYEVRKKIGGVSALSAKVFDAHDSITYEDAKLLESFLKNDTITENDKMARVRQLMKYVAPFSASIPGSHLHMQQERNKMRSVINSPLTCTQAHWRWFFTSAQNDMFNPLIFDNLVAPSVNYADTRSTITNALSKETRIKMIRQNPVIPVRLWTLQQDAFFTHIVNGSAKPLGGLVVDWVEKLEFQDKGSIHSHYLYCVSDIHHNDEFFHEINTESVAKMKELVQNAATATIFKSETIPNFGWDWQHGALHSFSDAEEPQRNRFDGELDYSLDDESLPISALVGLKFQNLQLSAYMHSCRQSCWKYCIRKPSHLWTCRYEFPFKHSFELPGKTELFCHESDLAQVLVDTDRKGRPRVRVLPPRNNANVAPCPKSALMVLAAGANTNLQFLTNKYGAVEYTTGYVGKVDMPENKVVLNTILKLLALGNQSHKTVLQAIMNGMSNGRRISATEAALYFLTNKIVKYSRTIKNVNPRPIQDISLNIDFEDHDDNSGLKETSQHASRKDYGIFVRKQLQMWNRCEVPFYSYLTSFSCTRSDAKGVRKRLLVPQFTVNNCTGVVENAVTFDVGDRHFIASRSSSIIHYRPFFKLDETVELSCSCLLLMYVPWPNGEEALMLNEEETAVEQWDRMKNEGNVPEFALHFIKRELHRQGLSVGNPVGDDGCDDGNPINQENDCDRGERDEDFDGHDYDAESRAVVYQPALHLDCRGVQFGTTPETVKQCHEFISNWKEKLTREAQDLMAMSESETMQKFMDPHAVILIPNYDEQLEKLNEMCGKLNVEQKYVFESITAHIIDPTKGQIIGFITGEGGTGKSTLISALKVWTTVIFGKQEGALGACALCAPTGPSAFNIGGDTWHSAFSRGAEKSFLASHDDAKNVDRMRSKFRGLQLLIFDEISMIGARALYEIHLRCQLACNDDTRRQKPFGGYHILFWGVSQPTASHIPFRLDIPYQLVQDFYQLPPPMDESLARKPSKVTGVWLTFIATFITTV
jgi:hypothetical protein